MSESLGTQLISPEDAAELLNVDKEQVYKWMSEDKVPYEEATTPDDGPKYILPMHLLLSSLDGIYDLPSEVEEILLGSDTVE